MTITAGMWAWWIAAVILAALEIFIPGASLIWIGGAAALVGLILILMPDTSVDHQFLYFALITLTLILGARLWARRSGGEREGEDHPHLNRRAEAYIGTVHQLQTAIINGRGRARVDDGMWTVEGTDLPEGRKVRVVGVNGAILKVEPVDE